ncbi:hypothetical protein ZIOFF_062771 [Zingiber officinale]|uniref:Uncharacterized protein n=1 Tax=Zingiber officinale TaxID=94328 RepID=A0A8J5KJJ5_ZINOF|nr:hypothetical protein ZIOFF_062771 [Zingiber officinale]
MNNFLTSLRSLIAALRKEKDAMDGFLIRFTFSLLFSFSIAARALMRRSVDFSVIFVGIPAMVIHMLAGYRFCFVHDSASVVFLDLNQGYEVRIGEEEGNRGGLQGGRAEELVSKLMMLLSRCQKCRCACCLWPAISKYISNTRKSYASARSDNYRGRS